jgi:hypothetical protein
VGFMAVEKRGISIGSRHKFGGETYRSNCLMVFNLQRGHQLFDRAKIAGRH